MLKNDISKIEVKEIEKNYRSVFATQDIEKDDFVFVEDITAFHNTNEANKKYGEPILLTWWLLQNPELYKEVLLSGVRKNLWKMKTPKDDAILLENIKKQLNVNKDKIEEIYNIVCAYNTRTYFVQNGMATPRIQLSPIANMINHSCNPNLSPMIIFNDLNEFKQRVAAFKAKVNINKGDEITYSYLGDSAINPNTPLKERKLKIKKMYGFKCSCTLCQKGN